MDHMKRAYKHEIWSYRISEKASNIAHSGVSRETRCLKVFLESSSTCKRSRFNSINVSPQIPRWLPKQKCMFVRDYARNIFRFNFWNDDVCFFVWIYEMEQFKPTV